ncbi:MAG: hypothetical protein KJO79_07510 [Verrucomicrobiae bacterium]|nr:hypothetical protein [Verrucomicrobiae bacterium]NNJ87010.1 hypothetical protein [Akkermansiaceae bacterium]
MPNTLVYLHSHVVDHLAAMGNKQAVIGFINRLASSPEVVGDYQQPDPRGRMIEVKLLGRQAILFFRDPYADIIKILELRNVESL